MDKPSELRPRALYQPLFSQTWYHDIPPLWSMFIPFYDRKFFNRNELSLVDGRYTDLNTYLSSDSGNTGLGMNIMPVNDDMLEYDENDNFDVDQNNINGLPGLGNFGGDMGIIRRLMNQNIITNDNVIVIGNNNRELNENNINAIGDRPIQNINNFVIGGNEQNVNVDQPEITEDVEVYVQHLPRLPYDIDNQIDIL